MPGRLESSLDITATFNQVSTNSQDIVQSIIPIIVCQNTNVNKCNNVNTPQTLSHEFTLVPKQVFISTVKYGDVEDMKQNTISYQN